MTSFCGNPTLIVLINTTEQTILNKKGSGAFISIFTGLIVNVQATNTRSDVEFILQWGSGHQNNIILRELIAKKKENRGG